MRTRVKICGLTRVNDALFAARAGADAIGLVFYPPSPRHIDIATASEIVRALPAFVTVVALFADASVSQVKEVMKHLSVDCLQFHGDETPEQCRIYGKPYLKGIRMKEGIDVPALAKRFSDAAGLLLDAYEPGVKGGSGNPFDWNRIPRECPLPIILAGGLKPENAALAVSQVQPYALDVSSGVEINKGIKDEKKMAAFIRNTNQAIPESL